MATRELVITMARRMIKDLIWKSTIIEGLGLTFPETELILENIPVTAKSSDIIFVMNMKHAWEFLLDSLDCKNDLAILRQLNNICGTNLIYECGELRRRDVRISGCSYVPKIPEYFDVVEDLTALDSIQNPVGKAIAYFCYVAKQQLFIDGNKRVAQLIMNKILIESGVGFLYIEKDKTRDFLTKLLDYYETGNTEEIFRFMYSCIEFVKE